MSVSGRRTRGLSRRVKTTIFVIYVLVVVEVVAYAGLFLMQRWDYATYRPVYPLSLDETQVAAIEQAIDGEGYLRHDPVTGWSIRPGAAAVGGYAAHEDGYRRNVPEVAPEIAAVRVATFGDSFTHGDDVAGADTWQSRLELLDPTMAVLNYGVPGYGVDQALLRYRDTVDQLAADVVLIGFMSENIARSVNAFRPFYSQSRSLPFSKPRFEVQGDTVVLVPNPLDSLDDYRDLLATDPGEAATTLGEHDYFFQNGPRRSVLDRLASVRFIKSLFADDRALSLYEDDGTYDVDTEAYRVTLEVVTLFAAEVAAGASRPIVLFFPSQHDLLRSSGTEPSYLALKGDLQAAGLEVIDIADAFEDVPADGLGALFTTRGHYTPDTNQLVADHLVGVLNR